MKVKFKKLHEKAVLPSYATKGDAGLDLTAIDSGTPHFSKENEDVYYFIEYDTGISVEIPENHVGFVFPRSSISKTALFLANSVGVIDSGYRGSIKVRFKLDTTLVTNTDDNFKPALYKSGDRIAQLIIVPIPKIEPVLSDTLSKTDRNDNGFGSTGK